MRFSVFTASTPDWTPADAVRVLAAQGWDGVEWRVTDQEPADPPGFWAGNRATWPLTGLEGSLPEIARVTRDAGLAFSGLGGYARVGEREDALRLLRATAELGAGRVRLTMPAREDADYRDVFAGARRDLAWAVDRARELDVKVLVELHHRTITPSASAALRLVDGLDPDHVGVIHDLGNLVIEGYEDTVGAFQMLGEYLAHVHVKNVRWAETGSVGFDGDVGWTEHWASLRSGQASVVAYFEALADVGYDGWVTLEDFSTGLPLEARLADDLAYLRSVREHVAERRAG
jgi:sugar phosphate isomerase/epimerase